MSEAGKLRRNVLIFHSGALGDFVLSWPMAMAVGRVHAQSRVFYVAASEKGKLAERVLGVESRDVEGGWGHLFGETEKLPEGVRRMLEGARLVVNFVAEEGSQWVENVKEVSQGAEVVTIRQRIETQEHVSLSMERQLAGNRVLQAAVEQMIRSVNEKGVGTIWKGGKKIVIHPGSGAREKCWAVQRWAELISRLKERGEEVRVVMGEVERERFSDADVKRLGEVKWLGTYGELLDELAGARGFVGNDSGPGHLAGVIGVPTVSLFGVTEARVWKPMGPRVKVIAGEGMGSVGMDEVLETVVEMTNDEARMTKQIRMSNDE